MTAGSRMRRSVRAGDRIVTASFDKTARIWNVEDGVRNRGLEGPSSACSRRATFSPDGSRVATGARDGTARIWNAGSGEQIFVLHQPGRSTQLNSAPTARACSPHQCKPLRLFGMSATGGKSRQARRPRTVSVRLQPRRSNLRGAKGNHVDRMERGRRQADQILRNPGTRRRRHLQPGRKAGLYHGSSSFLPAPGCDERRDRLLRGHASETHGGTFSHDGRLVATVSIEGTARFGTASPASCEALGRGNRVLASPILALSGHQDMNGAFSPDDRLFATASVHGMVPHLGC